MTETGVSEAASESKPRVLVVGAGLIGSYVGGLLAADGVDVCFLVREGSAGRYGGIAELVCTPFHETPRRALAGRFAFTEDASAAAGADLVLVCVKSPATSEAAEPLRAHLRPGAVVVSLQNGVGNAERLRQALPGARVLGGIVAFNVVSDAPGSYRQTTTGGVVIEAGSDEALAILRRDGLPVTATPEIVPLQWGKLLINLNNALVALADVTLAEELGTRGWRQVWARQIDEGMAALRANGIEPQIPGPKLKLVMMLLRLPNWIYRIAARRVASVDPDARSSMWEDIRHGRPTEIDELQGAIVRMAAKASLEAPVNARVMRLIRGVEEGSVERPVSPAEVLRPKAYSAA